MHPILFKIGPVTIYSYGVMVALGFLTATYLIIKELRKNPIIKIDQAMDLTLFALIFGILGARLLHVVLNIRFYIKEPGDILLLNRGGLAFQGGIITAVGFSLWFLIRRNLPVWKTGDLIMPYVALGQCIGRIGCFLNGCCFGKATEFMLGVRFPQEVISRHPTQLYSVLGLFIIFLILKSLYRRRRFEGRIFLSYFVLYSIFRFFIDFLRGDLLPVLFGLTVSQLISIIIFLPAAAILSLRGGLRLRLGRRSNLNNETK